LDKLGPDALSVTGSLLLAVSRGRKIAIKPMLLDQTALAGVVISTRTSRYFALASRRLFRQGRSPELKPTVLPARLSQSWSGPLPPGDQVLVITSSLTAPMEPIKTSGSYTAEKARLARAAGTAIARKVLGGRGTYFLSQLSKEPARRSLSAARSSH